MSDKQQAFLKLYEPVHERFERFCRARVFGDMDFRDLMNDTLVVAYEKIDTLKSTDAFLSFLFGISVRLLGNYSKKKKEQRLPEHIQIPALSVVQPSHIDVHYLYEALSCLPEKQRECLILFEISGFSIKEITIIQNTTESSVKQRLKRGREQLTRILTFEASPKINAQYE